jgi:hypothetical protein
VSRRKVLVAPQGFRGIDDERLITHLWINTHMRTRNRKNILVSRCSTVPSLHSSSGFGHLLKTSALLLSRVFLSVITARRGGGRQGRSLRLRGYGVYN